MKAFFCALRANFLPASIIPFLIGVSFAYKQGYHVPAYKFLPGLIAVICAHLAGNLFNDYFDFKSGADNISIKKSPFFGGSRAIQDGAYAPGRILWLAVVFLVISLISGIAVFFITGNPVFLAILAVAGVLTFEYTAPPLRLAYNRLGELDIFFLFGALLVMGGFYLCAERFTLSSLVISLPISFLVTGIIVCNEIPDFISDSQAGKNNLISMTGRENGYILYAAIMTLAFLSILINVLSGNLSALALILMAVYPVALKAAFILKNELDDINGLISASRLTILAHSLVGLPILLLLVLK